MTVLRVQDLDLHNEDGSHIDPGKDRSRKAKLKRHLDRHARQDLPEIGLLKVEMAEAERLAKEAEENAQYVREWAMGVVRQHLERGVKRADIARKLGIDERALYDFLRYGKRRGGADQKGT